MTAPRQTGSPPQEDRPLAGAAHPDHPLHWKLYACEMVATMVLMLCGIVSVAVLTTPYTPIGRALAPHPLVQTALCGLFFGLSGTVAAFTPFGQVSGAHVSPSVSLAFSLAGRLGVIDLCGYVAAQMTGACLATILLAGLGHVLPVWGQMAQASAYAATIPFAHVSVLWPLVTELVLTVLLVLMICYLAAHPVLKWLTPWAGGLFFLACNPISAWLSGNSSNLARSFGPALIAGQWQSFWIYALGPFMGAALAIAIIRSRLLGRIEVEEARLVNFGHHGRIPSLLHPGRHRQEREQDTL
ncbi:porin [Komagataeibacter nataicola]|uniref:Porin n=1 Tax=Komagataeibacter nataicola TaxID=265960 RepID=A0A9N7CV68_9PROT|nr:aquaporin [Komagataeibacter nataicola]AQU87580.1 porin [Komagataeibacter nataicola]PYD67051.1 porin [Komagataeibacter nataicola]WEQ55315.1 aquaporin [Komagataeibacter nataicola]WNM09805.1 aquaporin [Komagataeibacter nataicola]GBR18087.1 major facilitator superfamily glycerol uptake transporter [Komagataeibacter nataicola NRIC 0616]